MERRLHPLREEMLHQLKLVNGYAFEKALPLIVEDDKKRRAFFPENSHPFVFPALDVRWCQWMHSGGKLFYWLEIRNQIIESYAFDIVFIPVGRQVKFQSGHTTVAGISLGGDSLVPSLDQILDNRRHWITITDQRYIAIHEDVWQLLSPILSDVESIEYCDWHFVLLQAPYRYNWIDFGQGDPSRLSGMADNLEFVRPPDERQRLEKGTFLKPAKLLRAITGQKDVTKLAQKLSALLKKRKDIWKEIKVSNEPSQIYQMSHSTRGSISNSCMMYEDEKFFELYDRLEECRIAYLSNGEGLLLGRALLWDGVNGDLSKFMDRIYSQDSVVESAFKRWAEEYGYPYKAEQSYDTPQDFVVNSRRVKAKVSVDAHRVLKECKAVPYVDTLFHVDKNLVLSNFEPDELLTTLREEDGRDSEKILVREV